MCTLVWGVMGMWREKKSPCARASSQDTSLTPSACAFTSDAYGSYAITLAKPRPMPLRATSLPTWRYQSTSSDSLYLTAQQLRAASAQRAAVSGIWNLHMGTGFLYIQVSPCTSLFCTFSPQASCHRWPGMCIGSEHDQAQGRTLPKPIMQSVLPTMETPTYLERAHLPAFTLASACATLRDSAQMSAMPCSAAAIVLAVGAFTTRQPCCATHNNSRIRRCQAVSHRRLSMICITVRDEVGALMQNWRLSGIVSWQGAMCSVLVAPSGMHAKLIVLSPRLVSSAESISKVAGEAYGAGFNGLTCDYFGAREGHISVALARSTLSTPTPALPTTLRRPLEASKTSFVTCK